jgi:muramoyltetrapeptide carboxypeptidase
MLDPGGRTSATYTGKEGKSRRRFFAFPWAVAHIYESYHHGGIVDIRKPRRLQKGDLIGLVSPASTIADPSRINSGVLYLERLGYRVIVGKHVLKTYGYLAGTDEERVDDIHTMFGNPDVRGIFCIRGGYGTPRLLSLINYHLIRNNPKVFVGYSDITAFQLALWRRCGLVCFQGPMVGVDMASPMDGYTEELFWRVVTRNARAGHVLNTGEPLVVRRAGKVAGTLLGGNLALVCAIMGTPFQPRFDGAMLFFEDTGEEPYRIDRMFAQLRHAGAFRRARGLLTGQFSDAEPKDPTKPTLSLEEVLRETAEYAEIPFLSNLPFGHESRKMTIPIGIRARLDSETRTLEYLEPAVR